MFPKVKQLLFNNLSLKQTVFKNTFWLSVSEFIGQLISLITLTLVTRVFTVTQFGKFSFALSTVSFFVIFADLGISTISSRNIAQDKSKIDTLPSILTLKILLSFITIAILFCGSFFLTQDIETRRVVWILSLWVVIDNIFLPLITTIRAFERMEFEGFIKIFKSLLLADFVLIIINIAPTITNLSFAYLAMACIGSIVLLIIFHKKIYNVSFSLDKSVWKTLLSESWPLTFITIFSSIYIYSDSILMGLWGKIDATGWYNASYRIIFVTMMPISVIAQSFFPTISSAFKKSIDKFYEVWHLEMQTLLTLAIPIIVGGIILGPRLIPFLYGNQYVPAVLAFQILLFMTGVTFISEPFSTLLVSANYQKKIFYISFIGAMINLILNFILIPKYSLYGAATATLISYIILLILLIIACKYYIQISFNLTKIFRPLVLICCSSLAMALIITYNKVDKLPVLLLVVIGGAVYFFALFVFNNLIKLFNSRKTYVQQ